MKHVQIHRSVHTTLKKSMTCDLTGRLILPGEKIIIFPARKIKIAYPIITPFFILFVYFTIVPFIPEKDCSLYAKQKKAMGMLTNVSL